MRPKDLQKQWSNIILQNSKLNIPWKKYSILHCSIFLNCVSDRSTTFRLWTHPYVPASSQDISYSYFHYPGTIFRARVGSQKKQSGGANIAGFPPPPRLCSIILGPAVQLVCPALKVLLPLARRGD